MVGISAGFLGGSADEGLSLFANVFLVLPALPLLVVILGYLPHAGELPDRDRAQRARLAVGRARDPRPDAVAAQPRLRRRRPRDRASATWRIIVFEILPNQIGLIAASFVGTVLYAILTSVALAFIGVADLSTLELRHDALLGAEQQRRPARRVVVVRAARASASRCSA